MVKVVPKPIVVKEVSRAGQPGDPQNVLSSDALMTEIVDCVADTLMRHAHVLIDLVEEDGHQGRLPIVAMDDLRLAVRLQQELHRGLGEEGESGHIVNQAVEVTPLEEVVLRVRVDEVAPPTVDKPEPDGAVNEPAIPGHPQIMVCDSELVDLVVAHTAVLRQNDVNSMTPQLQLAAEAKDHFAEAAGHGYRSTKTLLPWMDSQCHFLP